MGTALSGTAQAQTANAGGAGKAGNAMSFEQAARRCWSAPTNWPLLPRPSMALVCAPRACRGRVLFVAITGMGKRYSANADLDLDSACRALGNAVRGELDAMTDEAVADAASPWSI